MAGRALISRYVNVQTVDVNTVCQLPNRSQGEKAMTKNSGKTKSAAAIQGKGPPRNRLKRPGRRPPDRTARWQPPVSHPFGGGCRADSLLRSPGAGTTSRRPATAPRCGECLNRPDRCTSRSTAAHPTNPSASGRTGSTRGGAASPAAATSTARSTT